MALAIPRLVMWEALQSHMTEWGHTRLDLSPARVLPCL